MSPSNTDSSSAAKSTWDTANSLAEATQKAVGGAWVGSDSAAEQCGESGARWGLTRIGPGTDPGARDRTISAVEALWADSGLTPTRRALGGDAPGVEVRFPAAGTRDDGFFIEFATTVHGSTIGMQTPCTPGDVDALNREKYGERHTNTPPDIPGASPSAGTEPTSGATS